MPPKRPPHEGARAADEQGPGEKARPPVRRSAIENQTRNATTGGYVGGGGVVRSQISRRESGQVFSSHPSAVACSLERVIRARRAALTRGVAPAVAGDGVRAWVMELFDRSAPADLLRIRGPPRGAATAGPSVGKDRLGFSVASIRRPCFSDWGFLQPARRGSFHAGRSRESKASIRGASVRRSGHRRCLSIVSRRRAFAPSSARKGGRP